MARIWAGVAAAISLAFAALFTIAFIDRYWRHRDCFNDLGNCWVSEEAVNYTTSGFVWGPIAAVFAALFLAGLAKALRS